MIDPADKQTASLPLEQQKRGRGRPATGAALTPAEKQKAYRERMKSKVTAKGECPIELREALERLGERQIQLEKELGEWARRARAAEQRLEDIEKSNVTEKEYEQLLKMLDEANKEKKYWIDRALKKGAESTKPRFELQYKSHNGRWVKGAYQEDLYDQLMTKEAAEALRARMQKATDDDPKGTLTWRIKELK